MKSSPRPEGMGGGHERDDERTQGNEELLARQSLVAAGALVSSGPVLNPPSFPSCNIRNRGCGCLVTSL